MFPSDVLSLILSYGTSQTEGLNDRVLIQGAKISISCNSNLTLKDADTIITRPDNDLLYACDRECLPLVKSILSNTEMDYTEALEIAYERRNYSIMKVLFDHKPNQNYRFSFSYIKNGDFKLFRLLDEYYNYHISTLRQALLAFIDHQNLPAIKYCVRRGASVEQNHLTRAVSIPNIEITRYFLRTQSVHYNMEEALRICCHNGNLELLRLLISKGANIHTERQYPLRIAALCGNYEICQELIRCGANVKENFESNLRSAKEGDNAKIIRLFLDS